MNNFNHNISKLILQYINYTTDNLKRIISKIRKCNEPFINPKLTCLDIITQSIQRGYEGFWIDNYQDDLIDHAKQTIDDDRIIIDDRVSRTYFFMNLGLDLYSINIFLLDDVIKYKVKFMQESD
jgi:hypothetical protein